MIVYVETNFVLELALGQEQSDSCREILRLAQSENLSLAVPAYSLMEPYETLIRDARVGNRWRVSWNENSLSSGERRRLRRSSTHSRSLPPYSHGGANRN